jgi:uncharacterized damage-inducible protein DinB
VGFRGESERLSLDEAAGHLARTPFVLAAWLRGMPEEWLHADEGPGTWSPYVVVGHLIHGDSTLWLPRARMILERGESAAFETFDRFAQVREGQDAAIDELLTTFSRLRADNLRALTALRLAETDLARRGRHPDFGAVTLGELLATWVVHDWNHLAQIARVLARRLDADVGPWKAYLPLLAR